TNTTGGAATLYAWVDHDADGQFQADEMTSVAVPDGTNNANVTLDWSNLSNGNGGDVGDSVIRLRLTTDDLNITQPDNAGTADVDERALGGASDGEVEDHHHKVTFHLLIQDNAGDNRFDYVIEGGTNNFDVIGTFENKYGIGNVTYDVLVPTDDITADFTLTDYQMVMYKHDMRDASGNDNVAEIDALIAYRDQGGILLTISEGGIFTDSSERINAYILQQMGFSGAAATAFAGYNGGTMLPSFHPSTSAGALVQTTPVQTTGTLSTVTGIDHRNVLYTLPTVGDSCNNVDAMAWLIPYNPTSTGGYAFPKGQVGPYIGSGERQFFFTPNYWSNNRDVYQEVADFAYDYYEDATAFNDRNNWLNDTSNVNSLCSLVEVDFGDAPDTSSSTSVGNYTTSNQFNGPRHANSEEVYLGTAPTLETDAYVSTDADGDTDDGVTLTPAFSGENTYTVTINATNDKSIDANLVAWFDFNRNGQFEVSEGITQVVPANTTATDYPLTFNLAGMLVNSTTYYARFRITTDAIDTSSEFGSASDGEVEDYKIVGIQGGIYDGGDAPDSYMTSFASGGPYHVQTNNLFMGQKANVQYPDTESPVPSVGANSDDSSGDDDEDGLQLPPLYVGDTTYTLQALGRSVMGVGLTAKIVVWVDWDRSGTFDADEGQIYDGVPHSGNYTYADFTWTGLNVTAGDYYVRARIMPSTDAIDETTPGGYASLGEVEDHVITVTPSSLTSSGCNSETFFEHDFRDFNNEGWLINGLENNDPYTANNATVRSYGFYVVADANWDVTLKRRIETRAGDTIKVNVWVGQLGSNTNDYFEVLLDGVSIGQIASTTMTAPHSNPMQIFVQGIAPSNNMELTLLMHHELPGNNDYNVTDITVERIGAGGCTYDYGDAPDSYLTLDASVGARHVIIGTSGYTSDMVLGSERDAEFDGIPNVAADGDDTDGTTDDEDLVIPASIVALTPTDIDYVISGSDGYLNVWVDADIDDTFNTVGEHIIQDHPVTIGANIVETFVPYLGVTGTTYLRVRVCESEGECHTPSGYAESGEVEDHSITLNAPSLDFGDAPDTGAGVGIGNYRTLFNLDPSDLGAYHALSTDLYLGVENADAEANATTNNMASGDDITGTDDEGGIMLLPLLSTSARYDISAVVTNTTGEDAYLYTWIDWDNNGSFDKDEMMTDGVLTIANSTTLGSQALNWISLPALSDGDVFYLRTRITSDVLSDTATGSEEDPRSFGAATNGEVEDHRIVVGDVDFGDALDEYKTAIATNGAYHVITPDLYLGDQVADSEVDATPDILARSDDANTSPDDEDGINILLPIPLDATDYSAIVEATNTTGFEATLWAWIDFNQNGAFEASESQSIAVPDGTNQGQFTLTWTGLDTLSLTNGMTYMRLRISTDGLSANDWAGGANDGEVEDFLLAIGLGDLGDAPDSYGTDRVDVSGEGSGAMHIVEATPLIYLGAIAPDEEADGFVDGIDNSANATDDDNIGADEDGVTIPASIVAQPNLQVQLTTRVHTDANATVYGWLDFDRDGVFDPATEAATPITLTIADNDVDKQLTFTVPSDVVEGVSYLRVRICRDSTDCSTPHGLADDGEVEDHKVTLEVQYDYGDAPEDVDYKTLMASGGPRHALGLPIHLGAQVPDVDTDGFGDGTDTNNNATDDDTKGETTSDEDGITLPATFIPSTDGDYSPTVVCNDHDGISDLGATVYGWFDFNLDGHFDIGEFAQAACDDSSNTADGSATLTFTGSNVAAFGDTYLRLRITTDTLTSSDVGGTASNGEVEDHAVKIDILRCDTSGLTDNGAAPIAALASTQITGSPLLIDHIGQGGNGARKPPVEKESFQWKNGGTYSCSGTVPYLILNDGASHSNRCGANMEGFEMTPVIGDGSAGNPYVIWASRYWDRNNNNLYDNDDIKIITKIVYENGDVFFDQYYFLESANGSNTNDIRLAQGFDTMLNGEDKGYAFTIPYEEDGSYLPLGTVANTADQEGTPPFQLVGVAFGYGFEEQFMGYLELDRPWDYYASKNYDQITTSAESGTIGKKLNTQHIDNGIGVQWELGQVNECQTHSVRLLFSTVGESLLQVNPHDLGDAPDADTSLTATGDYKTQINSEGAAHQLYDFDEDDTVDLMLGTLWDKDDGTAQNAGATADDIDDVTSDEDGVVFNAYMKPATNENIDITLSLDADSDQTDVQLYAWIDWNRDGDWDDANELVVDESNANANANATVSYPITVPSDVNLGYTYLRVRTCFDSGNCNTSTGITTSGEVEDYRIFISDLVTTATCDQLYVTKAVTDPNYTLTAVTPVQ
ncbi:GEVED domain-containing protein, partial [Photobacterium andalusiense]|uniref:GEVED domain-containing protein n=1 Tax=Photobacterium andalusiense TaxID=2204296 RepID=UPI001F45BD1B